MAEDLTKTKARFLKFQGKTVKDENGNLLEGDEMKDGAITRWHNGMLDGQGQPAVELFTPESGAHIEFWEQGHLKKVATDNFNTEEIWENDKRIK